MVSDLLEEEGVSASSVIHDSFGRCGLMLWPSASCAWQRRCHPSECRGAKAEAYSWYKVWEGRACDTSLGLTESRLGAASSCRVGRHWEVPRDMPIYAGMCL